MRNAIALRRYFQRHAESDLPSHGFTQPQWHQVLIIPAYREPPNLLNRLAQLPSGDNRTLVILVLNRPDSDSDPQANVELRGAIAQSGLPQATRESVPVHCLNSRTDLYLYDLETVRGPTPQSQGVGLARKAGCDLALQWMAAGGISGQWLCSSDADATLPRTYFSQLERVAPDTVATVFPFRHINGIDDACNKATALYELRLHHYVLGLEYAGSPYAFHTLGSSLAIRVSAYAHVHGFPKRAGAEDFYLLNKLAKLGPVARPGGDCIELQARRSARVPFGTGPAVNAIMASDHPSQTALFYHPQCFAALAALLAVLPKVAEKPGQNLAALMMETDHRPPTPISAALAKQAEATLKTLGIDSALAHCQRQAKSSAQFIRQFHQWFDGFRTLKFIHTLRDSGLPQCSLEELDQLIPQLWPAAQGAAEQPTDPDLLNVEALRDAVRQHWHWR